jgi:hypothetical protein
MPFSKYGDHAYPFAPTAMRMDADEYISYETANEINQRLTHPPTLQAFM